jgi:preprotein translocase subunit SecG
MIILPLAAGVPFLMKLVAVLWVFLAICLILIILIQKGKGGGLSGAFGGAGGAGGLLGTKTGDFLTWVTIGLVIGFLAFGVVLVKYYKPVLSDELTRPDGPGPGAVAPAEVGGEAEPAAGGDAAAPAEGEAELPKGNEGGPAGGMEATPEGSIDE